MENGRMALKQKKASIFVFFWTSMMILHNTTLQRPFPKLKKHHPTNLYMLYLMAQSALLVCINIDKKMTPQWHCPSSLENPLSIIIRNHFSIQILNFDFMVTKILRVFTGS
jgi:nitric oxide reductase large subunit